MSNENNTPYFVNLGLNTLELEDWLSQQRLFIVRYNKLQKDKSVLLE